MDVINQNREVSEESNSSGTRSMTVNYYFAHRLLPSLIFESMDLIITELQEVLKEQNASTILSRWMDTMFPANCDDVSTEWNDSKFQVIIEKISEKITLITVKMPNPKNVHDAKYVMFVCSLNGRKRDLWVRYFTFELGEEDFYHTCEWCYDGMHLNYGYSKDSSLEYFVSRVKKSFQ